MIQSTEILKYSEEEIRMKKHEVFQLGNFDVYTYNDGGERNKYYHCRLRNDMSNHAFPIDHHNWLIRNLFSLKINLRELSNFLLFPTKILKQNEKQIEYLHWKLKMQRFSRLLKQKSVFSLLKV